MDIETLQQTNKQLIETLDELNKIRADGKAKRANAEQELGRIEGEPPPEDAGDQQLIAAVGGAACIRPYSTI